jgi:hypothetical protein
MQKPLVVTGWVAAAAIAVAAGIGAVALAQGGTLDPPTEPMSEDSVQAALESEQANSSESASPSTDAAADASTAPTGQLEEVPSESAGTGEQVFGGDGGTFLASCDGDRVIIEWWAPAQGWQVSNVDTGPAEDAEIEFESESDEEEYSVLCVGGVPQHGSADDDG